MFKKPLHAVFKETALLCWGLLIIDILLQGARYGLRNVAFLFSLHQPFIWLLILALIFTLAALFTAWKKR